MSIVTTNMSDDMEYDEPSGDEYTPDGKFIYGSATNDDNSYRFCLVTHNDEDEHDFQVWGEGSDKKYMLAAYDVQQNTLVDSIEYQPLDRHDSSQGWHCIACTGNKDETTLVVSQLSDFKAFRFMNEKFQRADMHTDQLLRVGYEGMPIRRLKITKDEKGDKYQMQVTRMITLSEPLVRTFDVDIA